MEYKPIIKDDKTDYEIGFYKGPKYLQLKVPKFFSNTIIASGKRKGITKEFFLFYRLFKKYQSDKETQKTVKENEDYTSKKTANLGTKENDYNFSFFELLFELYEDYLKNGLIFFRRRTTNFSPKGNINWHKTISSRQDLLIDNSVFYKKFCYNNIVFNYQHPVTILYACALIKFADMRGIKINLPYSFNFLKSFENNKNNVFNILRKYEREMFADRERKVFRILKELYGDKNKIKSIAKDSQKLQYAEKFDAIWEKMLDKVLSKNDEIKDKLPINKQKGNYELREKEGDEPTKFSGLEQIPDIFIEKKYNNKDYLLIVDAKNYVPNFEKGKGMPGTPDIVKQIFYKYFLSIEFNPNSKYELKNIINVFLLPAIIETQEPIYYLGKHSLENKDPIGDIFCFYIDFKLLGENYLKPNNKDYSERVVNKIVDIATAKKSV